MRQPSGSSPASWDRGRCRRLLALVAPVGLLGIALAGCVSAVPQDARSETSGGGSLLGETFLVQDASDEIPGVDQQDGGFTDPGFDGDDPAPWNPDELPPPLLSPAGGAQQGVGPVAPEEDGGLDIHGSVSLRYVRRSKDGQHDDDVYSFVTVEVGDPDRDARTFYMDGRVWHGISKNSDEFNGLEDSYSSDTQTTLYNAYVDFHDTRAELLRVGRQTDYDTPEVVYYDGVHVRTASLDDADSKLGVYGGISNHLYESSTEGDRVYGLYVESRPWDGGRVRFDWMHADDDRTLGNYHDDLLSIATWQAFDRLKLEGSYSRFENDNRDYRLASSWFDPEDDILVRASYYSLLEKQTASALEFDDLTTPLYDLYPYRQLDVSAAHGLTEDLYLQGGASIRVVDDEDDKSDFNRDVDRYYLTAGLENVGSEANAVSVTGEYWQGDRNQNTAMGMDLTRDMTDDLEASVGTYYSLYKVTASGDSEREDVQTYYVRFDYDYSEAYSFDFGYEFEDSSVGNYHNIRMAAQWRF